MPNCSKCNTVQAKMNKGNLCKKCFSDKFNDTQKEYICIDEPINCDDERIMIDLIKGQMEKESQWYYDMTQVLKDQIEYLKSEIIHKNSIIQNLIKIKCHTIPINELDYDCFDNGENSSIEFNDNTNQTILY